MDLHIKYRPKLLKQIKGQDHITTMLEKALRKNTSHSYLLSGPSGVGKTTIGRIIAKKCMVDLSLNLTEIDAATHSGADAMRKLTQNMIMGGWQGGNRAVIIDECHVLSKTAWQVLQKPIEEPHDKCYWILCTTEKNKVPKTITNRCICLDLQVIDDNSIRDILSNIIEKEDMRVSHDIVNAIVENSNGSARRAITYLMACQFADSVKHANSLMLSSLDSPEVIALCRAISKKQSWMKLMKILRGIQSPPETIRLTIRGYFRAVAMNEHGLPEYALMVLDSFSAPCDNSDGLTTLVESIGRVVEYYSDTRKTCTN